MKISIGQIQEIKKYPNSIYNVIKKEFLYHSNKIEGSTFTRENLEKYLDRRIVEGSHKLDDVYETINSVELFDFVVDTLKEPITKNLIQEFHRMLKRNTLDYERGFSGVWKKIPNYITGTKVEVVQPWEVDIKMDELIEWWNSSEKDFKAVIKFHALFELIHPFQDGNGRVGRFIMLKQSLENNLELMPIDEKYNDEYKKYLEMAQLTKEYSGLEEVFIKCQEFLEDKKQDLANTLKCL